MSAPDMKAWALRYAKIGWPVLPLAAPVPDRPCTCDTGARAAAPNSHHGVMDGLHVGCLCAGGGLCPADAPGKHPLTEHGVKDASADPAVVEAWWRRWPDANIGGACGVGYDVLDVDRKVPEAVLSALPAKQGPMALTGRASGVGTHLFFEAQAPMFRPPAKLSFGEWRSSGSYVVLAPSLHASGRRYAWAKGREPFVLVEQEVKDKHGVRTTVKVPEAVPVAPMNKGFREALGKQRFSKDAAEQEMVQADGEALLVVAMATLETGGYPVEETGDGRWATRCPCHAPMTDTAPHNRKSLSLRLEEHSFRVGRETVTRHTLRTYCFAGCSYGDVMESLGIPKGAENARFDRESFLRGMSDELVDLAGILDDMVALFAKYLVAPPSHLRFIALWTVHTHVYEHGMKSPRLRLKSPLPESGKSLALDLMQPLCRPGTDRFSRITAAALGRSLLQERRAFLLDEVDLWLAKGGENADALLGLVNDGFDRKGKTMINMPDPEGKGWIPTAVPVFAPVAFAGVDNRNFGDTTLSRMVELYFWRRTPDQPIAEMNDLRYEAESAPLADRIQAWALRHGDAYATVVGDMDAPRVPVGRDRVKNMWVPIRALAVMAGGDWPDLSDADAVALHEEADRWAGGTTAEGLELLTNMLEVFAEKGDDVESMSVTDMRNALLSKEEWQWAEYGRSGKPITDRRIAMLTETFRVSSHRRRKTHGDAGFVPGKKTWASSSWHRSDLDRTVSRYVSSSDDPSHSPTTLVTLGPSEGSPGQGTDPGDQGVENNPGPNPGPVPATLVPEPAGSLGPGLTLVTVSDPGHQGTHSDLLILDGDQGDQGDQGPRGVSEETYSPSLATRVLAHVREHPEGLTKTAIQKAVKGNYASLGETIESLLAAGELLKKGNLIIEGDSL